MSHSNHEASSSLFNQFKQAYMKATSQEIRDLLWNDIITPFIEKIPGDKNNNLVTFLYRKPSSELNINFSIYLDCSVVGLPFSKKNQLKSIPGTDIFYLTLILPNKLRTAYTFLKLDNASTIEPKKEITHALSPHPHPVLVGELKAAHNTIMRLHAEKKAVIDDRNPKNISYLDYEDPTICFFTESILELPMAPIQAGYLYDQKLIKEERSQLTQEKRFFEHTVSFAETSLKALVEYKNDLENEPKLLHGTRKYWIYLPPGYAANKVYPLCLFLDGSDYLNTIPVPSIMDRMIKQKEIPPCIAVFFEYSPDRRQLEYYGDDAFTQFLAYDLINIIREKHHLSVTSDPRLITIIGLSASGLAAIYAGLIYPEVFGNVITQSAALWSRKPADLEKWVDRYILKKADNFFCMEAGSFESVPCECQFEDGFMQALSILQANQALIKYMHKKGMHANFHEFVGGHNYVCYKGTLADRLKEVFKVRENNFK